MFTKIKPVVTDGAKVFAVAFFAKAGQLVCESIYKNYVPNKPSASSDVSLPQSNSAPANQSSPGRPR